MRVAVVTLHRVHNFGSALQTLATQELLRRSGFIPEFVDYLRPSEYPSVRDQIRYNFRRWDRNPLTRAAFSVVRARQLRQQEENFDQFLRKHITLSPRQYLTPDELREAPPSVELLCVGSDQVWNNEYHVPGSEGPYYLDFATKGSRKFSLASSFGRSSLNGREAQSIARQLRDFSAVSVRERSGVEILSDVGVPATHLVDPTLSRTGSEWRAFGAEPSETNDYVLVYQLHRNHDLGEAIRAACREHSVKRVVTVRGFWSPLAGRHRSLHDTTVEQFVGLLAGARHVVTDSFHGTAFSLNLERPFTAVLPPRYSERIESLLSLTGATSRAWRSDGRPVTSSDLDWTMVAQTLQDQRARFRAFLEPLRAS